MRYIILLFLSVFLVASCSSSKRAQISNDFSHAQDQFVQDSKSLGRQVGNTAKGLGGNIKKAANSASNELSEMKEEVKKDLY